MTLEMIYDGLVFNQLSAKQARKQLEEPQHRKEIQYFINRGTVTSEPLEDGNLAKLNALVNTLQILYNSECDSPISDSDYETLQEMLIDSGVPRITSDSVILDDTKLSHQYQQLRGTLDKVHYLRRTEEKVNASRKYLDDWLATVASTYESTIGKPLVQADVKVLIQPKFDGDSAIAEVGDDGKVRWLTRGDTKRNLANDISKVMRRFDDLISPEYRGCGLKFEVMVTEEDLATINRILGGSARYKNSRQVVTACFTGNDVDFKANYLYPVPLRYIGDGDEVEKIHPELIAKFPTEVCQLDHVRETIDQFAAKHKLVVINGMGFRTDGVVITILDPKLQSILGRSNDTNHFEVAYKFTEEKAYTTVKDVEFYVSEFGYVTPVVVTNNVIMKGNTINHASLSNKARFDDLQLHYGDTVCLRYDIIPYVTIDDNCPRKKHGKLIEFTHTCPSCGSKLDLDQVQVKCENPECPSVVIGRVANWCSVLKIHNLGGQTLETIQRHDLLKHGIRSLYKLRSKVHDLEDVPGLGQVSARKIISEIEGKRRLKDYQVFGALGIDGLSITTFEKIFSRLRYDDFIGLVRARKFDDLKVELVRVPGLGEKKADMLIAWLKPPLNRKELDKLLSELTVSSSFSSSPMRRIAFSGFRPINLIDRLVKLGYDTDGNVTKDTVCLVVPDATTVTSKTTRAEKLGVPKVVVNEADTEAAIQTIRALCG